MTSRTGYLLPILPSVSLSLQVICCGYFVCEYVYLSDILFWELNKHVTHDEKRITHIVYLLFMRVYEVLARIDSRSGL